MSDEYFKELKTLLIKEKKSLRADKFITIMKMFYKMKIGHKAYSKWKYEQDQC